MAADVFRLATASKYLPKNTNVISIADVSKNWVDS
jgi:hypothetical protein